MASIGSGVDADTPLKAHQREKYALKLASFIFR
jgi:hypothetical protein